MHPILAEDFCPEFTDALERIWQNPCILNGGHTAVFKLKNCCKEVRNIQAGFFQDTFTGDSICLNYI